VPQEEHRTSPLQNEVVNICKEIIRVYTKSHTVPINTICRVTDCQSRCYIQLTTGLGLFKIVLKPNLLHYTPQRQRRLGERRYSSHSFSASALDGGEWSGSRPGRALAPGDMTAGTHWTGGWLGPRADLDTEATRKILSPLPGMERRSPGRPARSQTLY
jgi:hypothetical protein